MFPGLQEGQVISVDPSKRRLSVQFVSGQVAEVRMGYHGPADGARVSHKALPGRGSYGLCAFPYGDNRAGIWVCGTYPALNDALTTDDDPFMEFDAHFSGAYELMDQTGQWLKSFPDGTFIQLSTQTTKTQTFRHTVDENQEQQLTSFPDSQRIPNPPSPRILTISHASGTNATVDASGNTAVSGAANATCKVSFNGAVINIDENGGVQINVASGQELQLSAGGGATSFTLVRTDLLVALFNAHIHTGGNAGGNTGVPVTPITAAGIQSTLIEVSE